jgi:hypothetical protein
MHLGRGGGLSPGVLEGAAHPRVAARPGRADARLGRAADPGSRHGRHAQSVAGPALAALGLSAARAVQRPARGPARTPDPAAPCPLERLAGRPADRGLAPPCEAPTCNAPAPLDRIERIRPTESTLSDQQVETLIAALPGDAAWARWLRETDRRLRHLREQVDCRPRVLWQERAELLGLQAHLSDAIERQFSLRSGHALLTLWLHQLQQRWNGLLETAEARLDEQPPAEFLDLKATDEETWHAERDVTLVFAVTNRYHSPVQIRGLEWNDAAFSSDHEGFEIQASDRSRRDPVKLQCRLAADTPNEIAGSLRLHCISTRLNTAFSVAIDCRRQRNISAFFSANWAATGERLQRLLTAGRPFYWIDGHYWSAQERHRLKNQIKQQFKQEVGGALIRTKDGLGELPDDRLEVFSPDLLPDAGRPSRLLDTLIWTLHAPGRRHYQPLALAIWQRVHPIPAPVLRQLGDLVPDAEPVARLLRRLLGKPELVDTLDDALRDLPEDAFGAWCVGEPVYAQLLANGEVAWGEAVGLYPHPAGVLDEAAWDRLLGLDAAVLDQWIGSRWSAGARDAWSLRRHGHPSLAGDLDAAAERLLRSINATGRIDQLAQGQVWRVDGPVVLLEQEYPHCHLLLGRPSDALLGRLSEGAPSVWLCIPDPVPGLPGQTLELGFNACMRLLHARSPAQSITELNRLLAYGRLTDSQRIFRVANGLGDEQRISRHFYGREAERNAIRQALVGYDQEPGNSGGFVVIGSRRVGKTSLRDWLYFYINREEPTPAHRRFCLRFEFGSVAANRLDSDRLPWWFYGVVRIAINDESKRRGNAELLNYAWVDPTDQQQRTAAFDALWDVLSEIQRTTGHVPVFLFDETSQLVGCDAPHYRLFDLLKTFVGSGVLMLIATAYPTGVGSIDSLATLISDAKTPLYNLLTPIELRPWTPDEAWDFLHSRLGYLGLALPLHFRTEALRITLGIPWIVHQLGQALCEARSQGGQLITRDAWNRARQRTLDAIVAELRVTIAAVARNSDKQARGNRAALADAQQFGEDRLLDALIQIATRRTETDLGAIAGDQWHREVEFDLRDLVPIFPAIEPDRLRRALNDLTETSVLTGDPTRPDRFRFAHNLLPAWVQRSAKNG